MEATRWYVTPAVERVELSNGDWVDVKRELTIGETKAIVSRSMKYINVDGDVIGVRDDVEFDTEWLLAHMIQWSAKDENGAPIELSRAALMAQPVPLYREISNAVAVIASKRVTEKNGRRPAKKPSS